MVVSVSLIAGCDQQPTRGTGSIPFNEDSVRGHIIKIDEAKAYTAKYRSVMDSSKKQIAPRAVGGLEFGLAESFNRDAIAILLNQKDSLGNDAAGIRVYYGENEGGQIRMILVPYDSKGNDIIHQLIVEKAAKIPGISEAKAYWDGGQAIDNGQRCPAVCSSTGGLAGN